ncbi:hypothetical protein CH367_07485 [Leptospira barantonii]|uniref:Uncharacterized protein n=1 Tax=Leptospira barantonii TaxID=2023184 RepID=A0ABX4NN19_9LEPT|nr:hypothetical protein CH367_07485 [Leptospira barantonii]
MRTRFEFHVFRIFYFLNLFLPKNETHTFLFFKKRAIRAELKKGFRFSSACCLKTKSISILESASYLRIIQTIV